MFDLPLYEHPKKTPEKNAALIVIHERISARHVPLQNLVLAALALIDTVEALLVVLGSIPKVVKLHGAELVMSSRAARGSIVGRVFTGVPFLRWWLVQTALEGVFCLFDGLDQKGPFAEEGGHVVFLG